MGTDCQKQLTEEAIQAQREAEERVQQDRDNILGWEEYQREMPAIEAANENQTVELLRENVEAGLNNLPEDFFSKGGSNTILDLDAKAVPTEQECRDNYRIGREIRMERYEIANFPVIMGIKDPETLERMPGIKDAIKDEMGRLYHSKLSPWFRDAEVVDRIILVDKNASDPTEGKTVRGATPTQREFIADKSLPRVVHVFRNQDTDKMYEGQERHRVVIHEICHLNLHKGKTDSEERDFYGIFHEKHTDEWLAACKAQTEGRNALGATPDSGFAESVNDSDEVRFLKSDFISDHVACWDADIGVEICPEMKSFFDKYLA